MRKNAMQIRRIVEATFPVLGSVQEERPCEGTSSDSGKLACLWANATALDTNAPHKLRLDAYEKVCLSAPD